MVTSGLIKAEWVGIIQEIMNITRVKRDGPPQMRETKGWAGQIYIANLWLMSHSYS